MQFVYPHRAVHQVDGDFAFARVPSVDRSLRAKLLDAYLTLDAFADARPALAAAYATAELTVLASVPTRRFREPWGLVCNESMHQGRPVVASDSVGAVAGGLVADGVTGVVVPSGDVGALADEFVKELHETE